MNVNYSECKFQNKASQKLSLQFFIIVTNMNEIFCYIYQMSKIFAKLLRS